MVACLIVFHWMLLSMEICVHRYTMLVIGLLPHSSIHNVAEYLIHRYTMLLIHAVFSSAAVLTFSPGIQATRNMSSQVFLKPQLLSN